MKSWVNIVVIVVCMILIMDKLSSGCQSPQESPVRIETIYDTIPGDSVPYQVFVPVPQPVFIDKVIEVPADVDTTAILRDYFSRKIYVDTITDDTSMLVVISDTIQRNEITGRGALFQNLRRTALITTNIIEETPARNKLFIGGTAGIVGKDPAIGIGAMLVNKKDRALGYTWLPIQKAHLVNYHVKISFRR